MSNNILVAVLVLILLTTAGCSGNLENSDRLIHAPPCPESETTSNLILGKGVMVLQNEDGYCATESAFAYLRPNGDGKTFLATATGYDVLGYVRYDGTSTSNLYKGGYGPLWIFSDSAGNIVNPIPLVTEPIWFKNSSGLSATRPVMGDGVISDTWTVTCTDQVIQNFSVSGEITGPIGTLGVGETFSHPASGSFTISSGRTAANGDGFTFRTLEALGGAANTLRITTGGFLMADFPYVQFEGDESATESFELGQIPAIIEFDSSNWIVSYDPRDELFATPVTLNVGEDP